MLGSLIYAATRTRLDIIFAVHYLSQFSIALGSDHLIAMKRVYRYLNGTQDLRITFYGNWIRENLTGFTDSDWAGDSNSRRSIAGYAFIFCGAVIAWLAKKQPTIALSSTEAEYMALTHTGKEAVFLNHLFNNIRISHSTPITLLIDNQSAIALAENPIFHARSKHIEVRHHWIHEKIEGCSIKLEYVPTVDQTADIFTKALDAEKFRKFQNALGVVRIVTH